MQYTHYGPLPNLNLTNQQLKNMIRELLANCSSSFDFGGLVSSVAQYVTKNGVGLDDNPNTIYTGGLSQYDTSRVREVIWDFIVERYITPGGHGHDTWPSLTITEKGKGYFNKEYMSIKPETKQ